MVPNRQQYNEDNDLTGDACDPCPIASGIGTLDDDDDDNDGVGLACDPSPDQFGDTLHLFDGLNEIPVGAIAIGPQWQFNGRATVNASAAANPVADLLWNVGLNAGSKNFVMRTNLTIASFSGDVPGPLTIGLIDSASLAGANGRERFASDGDSLKCWVDHFNVTPLYGGDSVPAESAMGLHVRGASATFDWILIVETP